MKKGLYLTLALVTIAFLSTSAYSVTLTIDEIPDIIIGDMEAFDEAAHTQDANLFEFTEVFVFDDVLSFSDESTDFANVKWSYAEFDDFGGALQTPGSNWIEVNQTDPLSNLATIWNPPTDISQTPEANFRHIALSPPPGDYYPEPDAQYLAENGGRVIDFFATYNVAPIVTSDTETVAVYAMDDVYDSFSEVTSVWSQNFESEDGSGWTWTTFTGDTVLSEVASSTANIPGTTDFALWMTSDDTVAVEGGAPGIAFGFWTSPSADVLDRIPYTSGMLYKIRWNLVSSEAAAVDQPGLRLRTQHAIASTGGDMVIQGSPLGAYKYPTMSSDVNNPGAIDHYWYPAAWLVDAAESAFPEFGGFFLSADMWDNVAAPTGTHYISSVEVFEIDPADLPAATTVVEYPSFIASDWNEALVAPAGNTSFTFDAANGLEITYPDVTGNTFRLRFYEYVKAPGDVTLEADTLYRATYLVSSTGNAPPVFRQRLLTGFLYLGAENVITPNFPTGPGFDFARPGATPQEVIGYLPVTDEFFAGDWLMTAMDTYGPLATGVEDPYAGSYAVTSIKVEKMNLNLVP